MIGSNECTNRKITSLTYERAKKRLNKEVEGFLSGSGNSGYIKPEKFKYTQYPAAAFNCFLTSIRENTATFDSINDDMNEIINNKDCIMQLMRCKSFPRLLLLDINNLTMSDIKDDELVNRAYETMILAHVNAMARTSY